LHFAVKFTKFPKCCL